MPTIYTHRINTLDEISCHSFIHVSLYLQFCLFIAKQTKPISNTCVEYLKFVIVMFIIAIASYCSKPTTFSSDIQEEGKYIHKTSLWPSYHYKIVASFNNTGRQHFVSSINSRIPYLNDSNRTSILVEYLNSIIRWDEKKNHIFLWFATHSDSCLLDSDFNYTFQVFSVCYRYASLSNSFYSPYNKLLLSKR